MKTKYLIIFAIGVALFAAATKSDSDFLRGSASFFLIWGFLGDILNGVTIIKKEATTINTQKLDLLVGKDTKVVYNEKGKSSLLSPKKED